MVWCDISQPEIWESQKSVKKDGFKSTLVSNGRKY